MSLRLEVPRDKPQGFWMMDDASPYNDYSGYGRVASSSAAPKYASLTKGAVYSSVFDRSIVASFATPIFQQGKESDAFTLEATVRGIPQSSGYAAQAYRENWALNPRSESSSSYSGPVSSATVTRVTTERVVGAASIQVVTPGTINLEGYVYAHTTANQPKLLGATGSFISTVLVKGAGSVAIYVRVSYTTGSASTDVSTAAALTSNWQSVTTQPVTIDPTRTISNIQVFVRTNGIQAVTYYVGGVTIENAATSIGYFDGTSPGFEWTGAADNSIARTRLDVSAINQIDNPFVTLTAGRWLGTNSTLTRTTADFYEGDSALLATATATPFNVYPNGGGSSAPRVRPGRTYYHKAAVKKGTAIGNLVVIFYWYKVDGTASSIAATTTAQTLATVPTNWTVVSNSAVAPADAFYGTVVLQSNGSAVGQTFMVDSSYYGPQNVTTVFDGATPGAVWNGTAYSSYSLMYPSTTEQQIIGNTGRYDGLTIEGTKVSFVTKYLTTGESRCTYDLQIIRKVHAVGIHTSSKNSLYIDGALVAESDITEAQQADQYVATDALLYAGQSLSSAKIALNGVSTYNYALSADSIRRHYVNANDCVDQDSIAATNGGVRIPLSKEYQNTYLNQTWQTAADWSLGQNYNVSVEQDQLLPQFINGSSLAGYWLTVVPLSGPATIAGINMNWDGEGAVVQASLDGTTWETVTRGVNLALAPSGFNPANQILHIKVSFVGGIASDPSFLDNLSISGFKSASPVSFGGWAVSAVNAYFEDEKPVNEFNENFGLELRNGILTLTPAVDATASYTIEIWYSARPTLATNLSGYSTLYSNGGAVAGLANGEWNVRHYVFNAGRTGDITVSGTGQVGQVVIYPTALSAAQVDFIYRSYTGVPTVRVTDPSVVQVTESAVAAEIYEYDWAIESAG